MTAFIIAFLVVVELLVLYGAIFRHSLLTS
jgi:hypothetical protein